MSPFAVRYSPAQFALFRWLLGLFLFVYCARTLPYAVEIYGRQGMLPDPRLNFTYGYLPEFLLRLDTAVWIYSLHAVFLVACVFFAAGVYRRGAAVVLYAIYLLLFHRNNLTEDLSLAYVGWMLVASSLVPEGEGWSWHRGRHARPEWQFPPLLFWGAWVVWAANYSYSGFEKASSIPWVMGEAVKLWLAEDYSRVWSVAAVAEKIPTLWYRPLSWLVIFIQASALPFVFFKNLRFYSWLAITVMHLSMFFLAGIREIVFTFLLFQILVFQSDWWQRREVLWWRRWWGRA